MAADSDREAAMRIESSVTAISWIPSDAIDGLAEAAASSSASATTTPPRPTGWSRATWSGCATTTGSARPTGWPPGSRSRTAASSVTATRAAAWSAAPPSGWARHDPDRRRRLRDAAPGAGGGRRLRAVRADGRRQGRLPGAATGQRQAVHADRTRPRAWTTLALTINADGSSHHELVGASTFPRHWIYDRERRRRPEGRHDRLQALVPGVARRQHAVGRRGVGGAGDGRPRRRSSASCHGR